MWTPPPEGDYVVLGYGVVYSSGTDSVLKADDSQVEIHGLSLELLYTIRIFAYNASLPSKLSDPFHILLNGQLSLYYCMSNMECVRYYYASLFASCVCSPWSSEQRSSQYYIIF